MTDTFRKEYKALTDDQIFHIDIFKSQASDLLCFLNQSSTIRPVKQDERMMDFAKANLELAIMWAVKSIT
jgi:hypothetical protein